MFRYPGSKRKFTEIIRSKIPVVGVFCEAFAGTAAVAIDVARHKLAREVWINDIDYGIYAFWTSVVNHSNALINMVSNYVPDADDFYEFKGLQSGNVVTDGFRKLILHQISYSGLGEVAGSPIGGRNQTGKYTVGSRWNSNRIVRNIQECVCLFQDVKTTVTNKDWTECMGAEYLYLDPPYYDKGPALYKYGLIDHGKLSQDLHNRNGWLLSYDDSPFIRQLYSDLNIEKINCTSHLRHKPTSELIIYD